MIHVQALPDAPFGASVSLEGASIGAPTASELRRLLATQHLLLFRGERSEAEHVALIEAFGRVLPQGPRIEVNAPPPDDPPLVTFVSNDPARGGLGTNELSFHHDLAHVATPLTGLSLYAIDVAPGHVATRFASGRLAYLQLTPAMQQRLEGLQGLFTANYSVTTDGPMSARAARGLLDPTWPRVVHPVVVPHPVTGDRCIYVNEMMTESILGLSRSESDEILDELFASLYAAASVYEHAWTTGDLVVWDNLVLQHARRTIDDPRPRTFRRVVFGDRAPWEDWPNAVPSRAE
jgi:taurine dioxygenase